MKEAKEVKEAKEAKQAKQANEDKKTAEGEGEGDEEAGVDPEQIFKGKRVKDFMCFYLHQMKEQPTLEFDWFDE